jgi:hypothetical protein
MRNVRIDTSSKRLAITLVDHHILSSLLAGTWKQTHKITSDGTARPVSSRNPLVHPSCQAFSIIFIQVGIADADITWHLQTFLASPSKNAQGATLPALYRNASPLETSVGTCDLPHTLCSATLPHRNRVSPGSSVFRVPFRVERARFGFSTAHIFPGVVIFI